MHRRLAASAALIVTAALVLSACGGGAPALSDPKEILTKAVEALQKAKTVHLALGVDGSVNVDLTGSGTPTALKLDGTKIEGDLDIANKATHITLSVPAFLGLTGDVITTGGTTYTKTSMTGDKYSKSTAGTDELSSAADAARRRCIGSPLVRSECA